MFAKRVSANGGSDANAAPTSAQKRKFDSVASLSGSSGGSSCVGRRVQSQASKAASDDEDDDPFGPPSAASGAVAPLPSPPAARTSRPSALAALSSVSGVSSLVSSSSLVPSKGSSLVAALSRPGGNHRAKARHAPPGGAGAAATTPSIAAMFAAVRPAPSSAPSTAPVAVTAALAGSDSDDRDDSAKSRGSTAPEPAKSCASAAAASASSSSASPAAGAVAPAPFQPCIDDVLNVDYERKIASWSAHALRRQRTAALRGTDQECARCSALLISTTREEHARVCQPVPSPLRMPLSSDRRTALRHRQSPHSWRSEWTGSDLLRVTNPILAAATHSERRRFFQALRWLHSVLHAREGRDLEEDDPTAPADEQMNEADPEWALGPGQELWLLIRDGGLACAVVVQADVRRCSATMRLNTEHTRVSVGPKQTNIAAFLAPNKTAVAAVAPSAAPVPVPASTEPSAPAACSSSRAVPSASASAATSSLPIQGNAADSSIITPPLFGVDKIAVHALYRHGATGATASPPGAAPVSLAAHVLHSLLDYYSHGHTLCICASIAAGAPGAPSSSATSAAAAAPSSRWTAPCARQVAFSDPTQAGRKLAVRFVGRQAFTTYHLAVDSHGDQRG